MLNIVGGLRFYVGLIIVFIQQSLLVHGGPSGSCRAVVLGWHTV
jgi:hypothetical protein